MIEMTISSSSSVTPLARDHGFRMDIIPNW
jgi:hypothetical protein